MMYLVYFWTDQMIEVSDQAIWKLSKALVSNCNSDLNVALLLIDLNLVDCRDDRTQWPALCVQIGDYLNMFLYGEILQSLKSSDFSADNIWAGLKLCN